MATDPKYFDAVAAGDWLYCKSGWLGGGICEGEWFGPGDPRNHGTCINALKLPQLNVNGLFARTRRLRVAEILDRLAGRLRHVSICCGDWSRIFFPTLIQKHLTGIFLDPPYAHSTGRDATLYRVEKVDNADVAKFCRQMGRKRNVRIVLAGLKGEYDLPRWRTSAWSRTGGFAVGEKLERRHDERLWFSPHCLPVSIPRETRGHAKSAIWRCRSARSSYRK